LLRELFTDVALKYTDNENLIIALWNEIEKSYSAPGRFYHNAGHLRHLTGELTQVKDQIADWDTIVLSVFYHDIVYNTRRQNNEEESAALARERLSSFGYPPVKTASCEAQILATKGHGLSKEADTNFFTDADLSILGADPASYKIYAGNIRKEYSFYPNFLYNPGRRKVLRHFIAMDRIFKTESFYNRYEAAARENLREELRALE
jgi:predicted metal-dependent HD superfamily phosphohydrolase